MIKKIFLIHAPARSGKNTCAEAMVDYYKSKNKRCCIVAFGDVVKFTLEKYYGITDYKSEWGRSNIQHYATEQCRKKIPTLWADWVCNWVKATEDDWDIIIIPDLRFKNELETVEKNFPSIVRTINIIRPDIQECSDLTEEQKQHQSESELDNYKKWNYNIINQSGQFMTTIQELCDLIDNESEENE